MNQPTENLSHVLQMITQQLVM